VKKTLTAPKDTSKLHPKLRIILNSDPAVNASRAETAGCLKVSEVLASRAHPLKLATDSGAVPKDALTVKDLDKAATREAVIANVFVQTTGPAKLPGERGHEGNLFALRLPIDEIEKLKNRRDVSFVEPAETLKHPGALRLATGRAPPRVRANLPSTQKKHNYGAGVLIGIIDVDGFDWMHEDFDNGSGKSRFLSIWDQGRNTGKRLKGFDYGVEITSTDMAKAREDAQKIGVSPHDLEPQSQMVPGSHGTHVASIAAGNSGVCSKADIAAVLVSLAEKDSDPRTSFYDSTRLLDAVKYLLALADSRRQPVSINISLGTNGHAHDGSTALDRWIDALLALPGRSICVAAGNAGQEREQQPGDLGYILGRIHTSGRIPAKGLDHDIEWIVAGDTIIDVSENELELWYEPHDRIAISIKPPGSDEWIGPIAPGEFLQNLQLEDKTFLSIFNELYHPANGYNYISVYLTPYMSEQVGIGIAAGTWLVRLHGLDIRDGRFHAWIERDDPVALDTGRHFWPSFFSSTSNVDSSSVSSLACGARIISVANLDEAAQKVNISSSQGPTRDGRQKPDVAARGTEIVAANGFGRDDEPWIAMTGTSMASPYVAGVVGLMLAVQSKLTAAQLNGIVKSTARPLPGGTYEWVNDCGFGVIDANACVNQAFLAQERSDIKGRFE
jgi:subtilisin family serine protease